MLDGQFSRPQVRIGFLETAAAVNAETFDRFLLDHGDLVRRALASHDDRNRLLLLLNLGKRTAENPRVGLRFLDRFVDAIEPHEHPAMTDAAVHNIADVATAYPRIVAKYDEEVASAFEADDLITRRHACEALSNICGEPDVDAADVCEPYVPAIVSLFDNDMTSIRGRAYWLLQYVARADPETAERHLDAVIGGIYDERIGVQVSAMGILWEAVEIGRTGVLSRVSNHLDRIYELLNAGEAPLVVSSIDILKFVALYDPLNLDHVEAVRQIEGMFRSTDGLTDEFDGTADLSRLKRQTAILFMTLEQTADGDPLTGWSRGLVNACLDADQKDELRALSKMPDDAVPGPLTEPDSRPTRQTSSGQDPADHDSTGSDPGTNQFTVENLSDLEREEAVQVVLQGVSDIRSGDPDDITAGLTRLNKFVDAGRGDVVRPVAVDVVDALPDADTTGKALGILLLDDIDCRWLPYARGELDSVDEMLRESTNKAALESAVACVFPLPQYGAGDSVESLIGALASAAPNLDSERAVVKMVGLQATVIIRDSADADEHATILAAGLRSPRAASTAAKLLGGFPARFEIVPNCLLSAATACLDRPNKYEQSTLADAFEFLSEVAEEQSAAIAKHVDQIGYILSDQFETTEDVDYRALGTVYRLAKRHPELVSGISGPIGNVLSADDERVVKIAIGTIGVLTEEGHPALDGSVEALLESLDGEIQAEVRQKAVVALGRHITDGSDVTEDRVAEVVPHVDKLVTQIESEGPQVANPLLLVLGAVADRHPDAVGEHVDTLLDCLRPAADGHTPAALRPLKNVASADPNAVSDRVDTVIEAARAANQDGLTSDGILVVRDVVTVDPSMAAPSLNRLSLLVGDLDRKQEPMVGAITERVLREAPEAIDEAGVDAVLDGLETAETERYRRLVANGLVDAAYDEPALFESRIASIVETARALADSTPKAASALSGVLTYVEADHSGVVADHIEAVGDLATTLPPGTLEGCADVFKYVAKGDPALGSSITDQFGRVLSDGHGREIAKLLVGLRVVAETDPTAVSPYVEETVSRLGDDSAEIRAAAGGLLNTLSNSRSDSLRPYGDAIRARLTDDSDVATPVTRCFRTLVESGTVRPHEEDVERLLTHTDDAGLAECRMRAAWAIGNLNRQAVTPHESTLRVWGRRYESTPGIIATSLLSTLPRASAVSDA